MLAANDTQTRCTYPLHITNKYTLHPQISKTHYTQYIQVLHKHCTFTTLQSEYPGYQCQYIDCVNAAHVCVFDMVYLHTVHS